MSFKLIPFAFLLFVNALSLQAQMTYSIPVKFKELHQSAVYFDFGKYNLRSNALATLDTLFSTIKDLKGISIEITAHTDAIGTNEANTLLSQNRADAVKAFLKSKGINENVITAKVFGENIPIADNESDEGRQLNRRATIKILRKMPTGIYNGKVIDKKTKEGIRAEIVFKSKTVLDTFLTDENGAFSSRLPLGKVVGFDAYASCYFFDNKMFRVERSGNVIIELQKVEKGAVFPIKNLYFVGNKAELLPKSQPMLPKILAFMQKNDCGKIEIAGHINYPNRPPVDKTSWNYKLSQQRAKTVYDYLLAAGISAERMTWKGYGNYEMIYPQARSERDQALNRRVEIRITDTLKPSDELNK